MDDLLRKKKNIILLMGQSNMAGRGKVDDVEAIDDERIFVSWFNKFIKGRDPLFLDKWAAGVGPGMSFAKRVLEAYPECHIGLVACAVGGTKLNEWKEGGFLYKRAVLMAETAKDFGEIKGILWHQGEGDSSEELAPTYCERLKKMMAAFRKELGIENTPLVLGELANFRGREFYDVVNEQLHKAAEEIPLAGIVLSEGVDHIGDELHIDSKSQRKFGMLYAEKYLELLNNAGIKLI